MQYANDDLLLKTIQDNGSGYRSKAFKETHKVNSLAVYPRLHMKVVACGVSRAAHESDHLALLNLLSRCDADGRAMSVKCFKTIPMVNFDMVAVAFLHGGQNSGTCTCKGIQDAATGHTNLNYISHELKRLFSHMDPIGRIGVTEHTRKAAYGTVHGQRSIGGPQGIFTLLPESATLRTADLLIPHDLPAPDPTAH